MSPSADTGRVIEAARRLVEHRQAANKRKGFFVDYDDLDALMAALEALPPTGRSEP